MCGSIPALSNSKVPSKTCFLWVNLFQKGDRFIIVGLLSFGRLLLNLWL